MKVDTRVLFRESRSLEEGGSPRAPVLLFFVTNLELVYTYIGIISSFAYVDDTWVLFCLVIPDTPELRPWMAPPHTDPAHFLALTELSVQYLLLFTRKKAPWLYSAAASRRICL